MAKNLLGMHRVADTDRLKQLLKMARVLLNVNRVLIHQRVDALEKFKGIRITWLFHGVDGNLILATQARHELRAKVLLLCQNKHIINMQKGQTLFIA